MTSEQSRHIEHYLGRVADAGIPLVSQADRTRLRERHLAPSLAGLSLLPEQGAVLDIGSGGGFPAIPLAILTPHLLYTLVESNSKKAAFLGRVSRETECAQRVTVACSRVEELVHSHAHHFACVTARAVTELPQLVEWSLPLLAPGGRLLYWKGRDWRSEGPPEKLGLKLLSELDLPDGGRLLNLEPRL